MNIVYRVLYVLLRIALFFVHPILRVTGREQLPAGRCVICPNHSALTDPIWLLFALHEPTMTAVMAKKQLSKVPLIGPLLGWLGVIYVDRGAADVNAIKASLRVLRDDKRLIIFPEGTRVKPGKEVTPHTGAAMLAARSDAPLVPVYVTRQKRFLSPIDVHFGAPFQVKMLGAKATSPELQSATDELMEKIYALEES